MAEPPCQEMGGGAVDVPIAQDRHPGSEGGADHLVGMLQPLADQYCDQPAVVDRSASLGLVEVLQVQRSIDGFPWR